MDAESEDYYNFLFIRVHHINYRFILKLSLQKSLFYILYSKEFLDTPSGWEISRFPDLPDVWSSGYIADTLRLFWKTPHSRENKCDHLKLNNFLSDNLQLSFC